MREVFFPFLPFNQRSEDWGHDESQKLYYCSLLGSRLLCIFVTYHNYVHKSSGTLPTKRGKNKFKSKSCNRLHKDLNYYGHRVTNNLHTVVDKSVAN